MQYPIHKPNIPNIKLLHRSQVSCDCVQSPSAYPDSLYNRRGEWGLCLDALIPLLRFSTETAHLHVPLPIWTLVYNPGSRSHVLC